MAGTFDLRVEAVDVGETTLKQAPPARRGRRRASTATAAYVVELKGLDVQGDYAAQIAGATTGTPTPIPLVEVVGPAPRAVPPVGEVDGSDAGGAHLVVLASTSLRLKATSPGAWGDRLRALVTTDEADDGLLHLFLTEVDEAGATVAEEVYYNVTTEETGKRYLGRLLELQSQLARLEGADPAVHPAGSPGPVAFTGGGDGGGPRVTEDVQGSPAARPACTPWCTPICSTCCACRWPPGQPRTPATRPCGVPPPPSARTTGRSCWSTHPRSGPTRTMRPRPGRHVQPRAATTPRSTSRASGCPTRCGRTGSSTSRPAGRSPASSPAPTPSAASGRRPAGHRGHAASASPS